MKCIEWKEEEALVDIDIWKSLEEKDSRNWEIMATKGKGEWRDSGDRWISGGDNLKTKEEL